MKKVAIGVIMLGFATLGFSQSTSLIKEVKLNNVDVTLNNSEYEQMVSSANTPNSVIELQRKASRFEIKKSILFDKGSKYFDISFVNKAGKLTATYDRNGKILKTYGRFENLTFPSEIRNAIYSQYPNWTIYKDSYSVAYDQNKGLNKMYMAQLRKDGKRAKVKFDSFIEKLD